MKKILIIEDDQVTAHVYRARLMREGFEVDVVADGQSGWDRLLESRPDGVLLDLLMPNINGIELLKKIRAFDDFKQLPVIVYTNGFVPQLVDDAQAAGATKVFDKASMTGPMLIMAFQEAMRSDQ
jgi:CheY-like chemotaxis protein